MQKCKLKSNVVLYLSILKNRAWQALPLGGKALQKSIRKEISSRGTVKIRDGEFEKFLDTGIELTESAIEDIKVRLCFVPELARGQQIQQIRQDASSVSGLSSFLNKSVPSTDYTLSGEAVM